MRRGIPRRSFTRRREHFMLKKLLSFFLICVIITSMAACAHNDDPTEPTKDNVTEAPTVGDIYVPCNTEDLLLKLFTNGVIDKNIMVWAVDTGRADLLNNYVGLGSFDGLKEVSMMTDADDTIPYSVTLLYVDNMENVEAIKTRINDNIPIDRWENCTVDEYFVESFDNYILVVMLDSSKVDDVNATGIVDAFMNIMNNTDQSSTEPTTITSTTEVNDEN
jgi:hypothetical protein